MKFIIMILLFILSFLACGISAQQVADLSSYRIDNTKDFYKNQERFAKKYLLTKNRSDRKMSQFKRSFENCKLIAVERDLFFKINYYLFQDLDGIFFTVSEYYMYDNIVLEDAYNLNIVTTTNCLFDIDVFVPNFVQFNGMLCSDSLTYLYNNEYCIRLLSSSERLFPGYSRFLFLRKLSIKCI